MFVIDNGPALQLTRGSAPPVLTLYLAIDASAAVDLIGHCRRDSDRLGDVILEWMNLSR